MFIIYMICDAEPLSFMDGADSNLYIFPVQSSTQIIVDKSANQVIMSTVVYATDHAQSRKRIRHEPSRQYTNVTRVRR